MMTEIIKMDAKGYRKFGLVTGSILVALFGLIIPWLFNFYYPTWPWIIAAVLTTMALIAPTALEPVYLIWMKFGNIMNWINTRLILGILFYLIFFPVGLILKLLGKDPMSRKLDKNLETYRKASHETPKTNMEHPY